MFDYQALILAQVPGNSGGAAPPPPPPAGHTPPAIPPAPAGPGTTTTQPPGSTPLPSSGHPTGLGDMLPFVFLLGVIVLMFVMTTWNSRKEKKKRQAMLEAMKKGDKAQTIGGVIGTITELRENEVVLKVDPNTNTRMTFARSAIQAVWSGDKNED